MSYSIYNVATDETFDEDSFCDMHLYFPYDPTGATLEAATADFTLLTNTPGDFAVGTEIDIYHNSSILCAFYVTEIFQNADGSYEVSAQDAIGQFGNITCYGYFGVPESYYTLGEFLKNLITDKPVTILASESATNEPIIGEIQICSLRNALQIIACSNAFTIRTFRTRFPVVEGAEDVSTWDVASNIIMQSTTVDAIHPSKISGTINTYIRDTNSGKVLFSGFLPPGEHIITTGASGDADAAEEAGGTPYPYCPGAVESGISFRDAYTSATIDWTTGVATKITIDGTVEEKKGIIYNAKDGTRYLLVVLEGRKYKINKRTTVTVGNGDTTKTVTEDVVGLQQSALDNDKKYYSATKKVNLTYVMLGEEKTGDTLNLHLDGVYGEMSGRLTSIDIDVGGDKMIADAGVLIQ